MRPDDQSHEANRQNDEGPTNPNDVPQSPADPRDRNSVSLEPPTKEEKSREQTNADGLARRVYDRLRQAPWATSILAVAAVVQAATSVAQWRALQDANATAQSSAEAAKSAAETAAGQLSQMTAQTPLMQSQADTARRVFTQSQRPYLLATIPDDQSASTPSVTDPHIIVRVENIGA